MSTVEIKVKGVQVRYSEADGVQLIIRREEVGDIIEKLSAWMPQPRPWGHCKDCEWAHYSRQCESLRCVAHLSAPMPLDGFCHEFEKKNDSGKPKE